MFRHEKGRPRTKSSHHKVIVELFEHIVIIGRQFTHLSDSSEYEIPLDKLGEAKKKLLGIVARKLCGEVLYMLYPADNNRLKNDVYELGDDGNLILEIAETTKN